MSVTNDITGTDKEGRHNQKITHLNKRFIKGLDTKTDKMDQTLECTRERIKDTQTAAKKRNHEYKQAIEELQPILSAQEKKQEKIIGELTRWLSELHAHKNIIMRDYRRLVIAYRVARVYHCIRRRIVSLMSGVIMAVNSIRLLLKRIVEAIHRLFRWRR